MQEGLYWPESLSYQKKDGRTCLQAEHPSFHMTLTFGEKTVEKSIIHNIKFRKQPFKFFIMFTVGKMNLSG